MKRSGFKRLTYEEALAKQQAKQARQRAENTLKTQPRANPVQEPTQSTAAIQGKIRSKRKRAGKDRRLSEFRATVRERDDYTCQWPGCGYYDLLIEVQHIAKRSQRPDLIYDPENGVCLCHRHHDQADNTVIGRAFAKLHRLAGGTTYELAAKENCDV